MTNEAFPLSNAKKGALLTLVKVDAGNRLNHRMADLGLTPGVCLEIMQDSGGPILLSVRNSRVAVGRGMADKILVTNGHGGEQKQFKRSHHRPRGHRKFGRRKHGA